MKNSILWYIPRCSPLKIQPMLLWNPLRQQRIRDLIPGRDNRLLAYFPYFGKEQKFWEELIAYFRWYDKDRTKDDASNNYFIVACVFVAVVTFFPSRCLVTVGGYTYRQRFMWGTYEVRRWDGLRRHDIHTKFHNVWFIHSKVLGGTQTHRQHGDRISLLSFFQNKELSLIKVGLWDYYTVFVSVNPLINFWTAESTCMKLGMYENIMVSEPISMANFHESLLSVCVSIWLCC
jgi:hypothetical protein